MYSAKRVIEEGRAILGIEFGSTRIKAVLIGEQQEVLAVGGYDWENRYENGVWTYHQDEILTGLRECYCDLSKQVKEAYGTEITTLAAFGVSGMMHGYIAFDKEGKLLAPFRTWRNTMTARASTRLTELFDYHIPQRWSIAHLYQAILNGEGHVAEIDYLTTLAGYIHLLLTGKRVMGIGEASGMFPISTGEKDYRKDLAEAFDEEVKEYGYPWKLLDILPKVLVAGEDAGVLTEEGARLLDPDGPLQAGIPMCPPEGDAGTGMIATNSIEVRTGNVSAGTSVFAMIVLEKELEKNHEEIDIVTTPDGSGVAMVHCNNCTSDLNAWVALFKEYTEAMGMPVDMDAIYGTLYRKALEGDAECGGLLSYNYFSGEHITGMEEGRPLFVRTPESKFNLANFMRAHLFTALSGIKVGMNILTETEHVVVDRIYGHGGLFKTPVVGQKVLAAAMNAPVTVMETAGEGGAWGIAVLAAYRKLVMDGEKLTLPAFLGSRVFANQKSVTLEPDAKDAEGFEVFVKRYVDGLPIEKAATIHL